MSNALDRHHLAHRHPVFLDTYGQCSIALVIFQGLLHSVCITKRLCGRDSLPNFPYMLATATVKAAAAADPLSCIIGFSRDRFSRAAGWLCMYGPMRKQGSKEGNIAPTGPHFLLIPLFFPTHDRQNRSGFPEYSTI
jgi:hypothetical protein